MQKRPAAGSTAPMANDGMDELQRSRILACVQAFCAARYAREDNVPCQIEEGLFLGSVGAALNKSALKDLNITHILTVAKSLDPAFPNEFVYKKIDGMMNCSVHVKLVGYMTHN
ncbi:dual specificity protein phosphatase [Musa troglodytarum]|uniref:Dual specificity protein phosphatase n=1 Tax=Musa troglodytarum TaxID=320322 RepID=A0A9E7GI27_9LILI|nr:dual specificity protein phosphatase [Musa troglodytarum]